MYIWYFTFELSDRWANVSVFPTKNVRLIAEIERFRTVVGAHGFEP